MAFNYWQELEEGQVYHIYNKAITSLDLFRNEDDYLFFLSKYKKLFVNYFDTYAYCLIPNHFHLLVRVKSKDEIIEHLKKEETKAAKKCIADELSVGLFLSDQFRRFFSSLTIRYNKKYKNQGPIFVRKLKKIKVSRDGTIQYLLCYIHNNPIHHGLVRGGFDQWEYSSYTSYTKPVITSIAKTEMLDWLGGIEVFEELHSTFELKDRSENAEK